MLDLYSVGMERGLLSETIVTTRNPDGTPNAAPIGWSVKTLLKWWFTSTRIPNL